MASSPIPGTRALRRPPKRVFVRLEKFEQAEIVRLLLGMGAEVFVLGTRRPRATRCRSCGNTVPETQGTRQTPGLPDVLAFLKRPQGAEGRDLLVIEAKRWGGKLRPDQYRFKTLSDQAGVQYVVGTLDDVIRYLVGRGYLKDSQVGHYHLQGEARA